MMKNKTYGAFGSMLPLAACLLASSALHAQAPQQKEKGQRPGSGPGAADKDPRAPAGRPDDVVVTGTRSEVISTPDRVSFSVANDLQVQTGTLADALRAVPGVEVDVQGNVSLRGDPGVTILIDGRPSAMLRGENRGDVILSMPSSQIERVEVITNPSAAMSPEGSGGVINLVTRKARNTNSRSATIRANLGGLERAAVNLNGALSRPGLTVTGDLGYRRFSGSADATRLRSRRDPASGLFVSSRQDSELDNKNAFGSARLAVDYDLDPKNRLSTELSYREGKGEAERIDLFSSEDAAASFDRSSEVDLSQRGLGGRLSWRRTLPGTAHELVADLEAERVRMRRAVEAVTVSPGQSVFESIRNAIDREDYTMKLDYKRPTGADQSINLGYQGDSRSSAFDFSGAFGPAPDSLVPSPGLTNAFGYDETIHALFGTYRFKLGKLDSQAGLRLEQVDTRLDQITDGVRFERGYFRAYPTLNLSYELSREQSLRAGYSRRIQRPSAQDLNPYTVYLDSQNLRRGNPFLLPEVTDSFEAGFQHRKSGTFFSATGFYRRSRGGVTDIVSDIGGGVFLTTRANLATSRRIGADLIANGRLGKTLSYNASATLLWHEIDPRIGGVADPRSITTGTARASLSWQPTPRDFLQLNATYAGRQLLPQGYRESGAVLNLGYRRKVSDRLSLLATAQDVLDSARQEILFETPDLRDRIEQRGPGRIVFFGISYTLGGTAGRRRQEPGFDFQPPAGGDTPQ